MKRMMWAVLVCLVMLVAALGVSAQDAAVTTIPVDSKANPFALSPDGHTLAMYNHYVIYDDAPTPDLTLITLVDIASGEIIGNLSGFTDWVTDIDFNADGSRLVSFHRNGDMLLWDVAAQQAIRTIPTFTIGGGWVQFLGDGTTAAYRAGEFAFGLMDTESGAITRLIGRHIDTYQDFVDTYSEYPKRGDIGFSALSVSPDGRWLAAATQNDEVLVWDVSTADSEPRTLREPSVQFGQFSVRTLVFSADGEQLTYFDQSDDQFHVWNVEKGVEIRTYAAQGAVQFALAPDGKTVAWADRETNAVYLADTTSDEAPTKLVQVPDDDLQVAFGLTSVAFTSDGTKLVIGGLHAPEGKNQIYVVNLVE